MFASVMPLGDDLDHLEAAIDKVAAAEQLLDVARLHRLAERLDAVRVRAVGELDRSGAYLDDGFPSAAAWVREWCRLSHGAAHATVTLARKLTRLAETSHAFAAGDPRTRAQRRADAFARLCQLALNRARSAPPAGCGPTSAWWSIWPSSKAAVTPSWSPPCGATPNTSAGSPGRRWTG